MLLLDTNICMYIINNNPRSVVEKIKISAISVGGLEYGASKSQNRNKNRTGLIDFVSAFDIVPFNDTDAEVFGLIRAEIERRGAGLLQWIVQISNYIDNMYKNNYS